MSQRIARRARAAIWLGVTLMLVVVALAAVHRSAGATLPPPATSLDFGSQLWEHTTPGKAQARLPFRVLLPAFLPSGYRLADTLVPRHEPSYAIFIYANSIQPRRDLSLTEASSSTPLNRDILLAGRTEQVTVARLPAFYVQGVVSQKQGETATTIDDDANSLIIERTGVRVHLFAWRSAGVGREMLLRIAASLQ
jgi:hypothetical protein